MTLSLEVTKRTDSRLLELMSRHYSQPLGFVGRNICYAVLWNGEYYGHIVGGSATKFLPGRNSFFEIEKNSQLVHVINNIFFHVEPFQPYPIRNFTSHVVETWRHTCALDWQDKYGDFVRGWETLIELPRTGDLYRKDGWIEVGQTHGYTCKRTAGKGTDSWSGKRVWDTKNLKPKLVLVKKR
jgi:hypothetical protein